MLAFFLLLVIVAIVLGIVGVVVKGLLYLLIIGIVVFLGALLLGALRMRRRPDGIGYCGRPSVQSARSCGRASLRLVGLDSGMMIGRFACAATRRTTSSGTRAGPKRPWPSIG